MSFDSIYDAHGAFTAAITPPLVVTLFLSVFWRRFTCTAALWTMAVGTAAIALSLVVPEVITPFAHGVPMKDLGDDAGLFAGMKQYKFMRACYGICVCSVIGVVVSLFTKPESLDRQRGLVWGTMSDALRAFKGSPGSEDEVSRARALPVVAVEPLSTTDESRPAVRLSSPLAAALDAKVGDLVYITDTRWWLGGLRSTHAMVHSIKNVEDDQSTVEMEPSVLASVDIYRRSKHPVLVERLD